MRDRGFGWDLPPGVNERDIPGNEPDDDEPTTCASCGKLLTTPAMIGKRTLNGHPFEGLYRRCADCNFINWVNVWPDLDGDAA